MEAVRLDLAVLLAEAPVQLVVDVAPCSSVSFPLAHLRSIVYNLLSDAVKYRHPDRPPVVHLRADCSASQAVIQVQDNDLGLDERQQAQLFGIFKRLHSHVTGSGVGLYLVRRMVENAGGRIAVQSQVDVGTTFTLQCGSRAPSPFAENAGDACHPCATS